MNKDASQLSLAPHPHPVRAFWNTIRSRVPPSLSRKQVARSSRLWLGKHRGGCAGLPMASTRRFPYALDTENRGSSQKEAHSWQQDSNTYWPVCWKSQEHRARDCSHNWKGAKASQPFCSWVSQMLTRSQQKKSHAALGLPQRSLGLATWIVSFFQSRRCTYKINNVLLA